MPDVAIPARKFCGHCGQNHRCHVLNRKNVSAWDKTATGVQSAVYHSTGDPDTTAWLKTLEGRAFVDQNGELAGQKYALKENNPINFASPRQIRFGLICSF